MPTPLEIFFCIGIYHPLVLKARHLSGSGFCWVDIGLPEQAVGWFAPDLVLVVEG